MKPVSALLLAVCVLAVEAQNLAGRTFGFAHSHHDHNHGAVHASQSLTFQAPSHHHPLLPPQNSHGIHEQKVDGHSHHQGQGHFLPGQQHHSNLGHEHHHQPSVPSGDMRPIVGTVTMVPVMVCSVVRVPAAHATAPGPSHPDSFMPNNVLSNITTSIGNAAGKVVSPLVTLLHNASVWLNRTAHSNQGHNLHHNKHPEASSAHIFHENILALKKHKLQPMPPSSRKTAVTTTTTSHPAVTASSPVPSTAAATPSTQATTVSVPVKVQTATDGVPAPALGATASLSRSFTTLPASSADTPTFPEGRAAAILTTVPRATAVFTLQPASTSKVPTIPPAADVSPAAVLTVADATAAAPSDSSSGATASFTKSVPQSAPTSASTDIPSARSGTLFPTVDTPTTLATASTATSFTESVTQSAPTASSSDLTSLPPTEEITIRARTVASTAAVTRFETGVMTPATAPPSPVNPITEADTHSTDEPEDRSDIATPDMLSSATPSPISSQATTQSTRLFTLTSHKLTTGLRPRALALAP